MFGSRLGAQESACSYLNAEMILHNYANMNLTGIWQVVMFISAHLQHCSSTFTEEIKETGEQKTTPPKNPD